MWGGVGCGFFFVQGFGGRKKKVRERNISGNIVMSSENYKNYDLWGAGGGSEQHQPACRIVNEIYKAAAFV